MIGAMADAKQRLLSWTHGAPGYTHDEIIIAVGFQCTRKPCNLADVLIWLGTPYKAAGTSQAGHLVYDFRPASDQVAMFDVVDGLVNGFGTVVKSRNNSERVDPVTGEKTYFNIFDEMGPFDESAFK